MLGRSKAWLRLADVVRTCLDEVQRWQLPVDWRSVIINVSSSMVDIGAQFVRLREHLCCVQDVCTNPGFVEYVLKVEEVAEGN